MADTSYEIKTFDLDRINERAERSKYPFEQLEVGQGFTVAKPVTSISGRVSAENKKSDRVYVVRTDKASTKEQPLVNVIRIK